MTRLGLLFGFAVSVVSAAEPLQMIVMDPLALQLSCACVPGTGQRRYDALVVHLEKALGCEVKVTFDESLSLALPRTGGKAHLIIGKDAIVRADAETAALKLRHLASLTDSNGGTELRGVFLVPTNSSFHSLQDLAGKRVALGPMEDEETHAAAKSVLEELHLNLPVDYFTAGSVDSAALAMSDGECEASVVSAFLPVLLEGCGKLEKGSARILGETKGVPFIRVFATDAVDEALTEKITTALVSIAQSPELLVALESRDGFVTPTVASGQDWPDWRGSDRKGQVADLPSALPDSLTPKWTYALTGPAMAGPAVSGNRVIIPDKSADGKSDLFYCLDTTDGRLLWQLAYDAPDDMEYTNAPRATPVIHDGLVYLQGALGHLHCVRLKDGAIIWKTNIFTDYGAELLNWGASIAPLVVGEKLIIAPGAKDASVVALNRKTGKVIWKTPGNAAAYSAFIVATFDGVKQIIGYDSGSLGAWHPDTGKRLWTLIPPDASDFNVTTPVVLGDKLLLSTENNGTRLYHFDGNGGIISEPVAKNDDLAPDTCTPGVAGDRIFATAYGELYCIDLSNGMQTVWQQPDDMFHDHCNIITSPTHALLWTANGDLVLLDAGADQFAPLASLRPFDEKHPDTLAHPAIAGGRLYLRSSKQLGCFKLGE